MPFVFYLPNSLANLRRRLTKIALCSGQSRSRQLTVGGQLGTETPFVPFKFLGSQSVIVLAYTYISLQIYKIFYHYVPVTRSCDTQYCKHWNHDQLGTFFILFGLTPSPLNNSLIIKTNFRNEKKGSFISLGTSPSRLFNPFIYFPTCHISFNFLSSYQLQLLDFHSFSLNLILYLNLQLRV